MCHALALPTQHLWKESLNLWCSLLRLVKWRWKLECYSNCCHSCSLLFVLENYIGCSYVFLLLQLFCLLSSQVSPSMQGTYYRVMRPEANITEVVGIWGFFRSVPSFGSEGISCIAPSHHLPAEVEKCMYYQHTYLNQQSIEKEVFKK